MPDSEKVMAAQVLGEVLHGPDWDGLDDAFTVEDQVRALLAHAPSDSEGVVITREGVLAEDRTEALTAALLHYWDNGVTCPCGARNDSIDTHPHVIGCPVGIVLGGTIADAYEAAVAPDRLRPTGISESEERG